MNAFPILETERLILRQLRVEDAFDLYQYFSKDEVTEFYDLDSFTEVKQAQDLIMNWQEKYNDKLGIRWGIWI
jgi:ribosomal-protein-alanine N-acetyltransferase